MLGYLSLNVDANKLHVGDVSALHTEFVLCSIFYPSTAWYYYGRGDAVARRVRSSMTIVYMYLVLYYSPPVVFIKNHSRVKETGRREANAEYRDRLVLRPRYTYRPTRAAQQG